MFQSRTNQNNEEEIDRWGIIRNWFYDNQADAILICGVILVAVIGFGMGRLTTATAIKEPVVVEYQGANALNNMEQTIGQNGIEQNICSDGNKSSVNQTSDTAPPKKGIIMASKTGKKYHWPWCSWAKKIKPENQLWFDSEAEAKAAGYEPCAAFYTQAPAGYKPQ